MPSSQWVFGPFRLDPANACLWCDAEAIILPPKAFAVLHYLVTHSERLVSKDELLDVVWPETAVSDAVVRIAIGEVRRALGDTAQAPQYITTVARRGYRFVAQVTGIASPEVAPTGTRQRAPLEPRVSEAVPPIPDGRAIQAEETSSWRCAVCQQPQEPAARFCVACGTPRPETCLRCGQAVSMPATFCPRCGQRLDAQPSAAPSLEMVLSAPLPVSRAVTHHGMAGERKRVTVLFCDLVDFTALVERLGPEAIHRLLQRFFDLALHEVRRYGGTLSEFLGDGFMALFGAPMAHEDHVRRALLAALGLQRRLHEHRADFEAEYGVGLTTRMGLHTGLAVVGTFGDNLRMDYTAVGDTTNLAARLQQLAAPDTILISEATSRLVQGLVSLEALAPVQVKGKRSPIPVYKVLGLGPHRTPLAGRDERALSPLVGRERELAVLGEVLEQVERGQGQAVGIVGEAGLGKSRLLYEFRQRLAGRRVTVLEGRCLSYGSAVPYLPLLDLLRSHCSITEADSPEGIMEKVRIGLQEMALEPEEYAPYLLHLLGVPAGTEPLALLMPEAVKARTFATLRQMHLNSSQRQPLILIVEDLHWIDKTSEEYLTALVESLAGAPLLVLGTYRVGYHLPWLDKSYTTQLTLRRLSPQDSLTVVHATGQGTDLPETLVHELLDKAEGNPFFLEELTRAVLEQGALGANVPVPDTIQGVLMARIDRLPAGPRHLLQTAAVLGRTCPHCLLEVLWEGPGDLEVLVQALQRGELLYERHGEAEPLYVFKHALTQEVAYDSLLQEQRRTLHARVVTAIEGLYCDRLAEQLDRLAHHAQQGALWDKAVLYCRQAGTRAMTHSAYREAVTYFEQALDALHRLPVGPDTQAQAIDLRLDLRSALFPLGEIERIFVVLQEAGALAEALGDQHRLGWISAYLLAHFLQAGEPDRAIASGRHALAIAATLREVGLTVVAQNYMGNLYRALGDYRRAMEYYRKNLACLHGELLQERFGLPGLASVLSCGYLAVSLVECGVFTEGKELDEAGVRMAEAAAHPCSRSIAYWTVGYRLLLQGDIYQTLPILEQAHDLVREAHIWLAAPRVAASLGAAYALARRTTDALPLLEQAVEQAAAISLMQDQARRMVWLSEAYLLAGRLHEAYIQAQDALELARAHQERGNEAYALRLLGDLAAQRQLPEAEQAEAFYRQALALAEELGMRPLQAHCHRGLGILYKTLGRREQARAALATAIALYRDMEMTYWLPQTEAALA
jgi:class 3 adenylate cyclase/DNA-binding winged helix-turn-helix (wHTH) protein/tetratricopeptide (TPR) repeat protein